MPFKDKEKRRSYNRDYQRLRRAGQPTGSRGIEVLSESNPEQIRTANALLTVLAGLIKEVLETKEGDVFMRSRTAGYLISIGLKAVEVADIEARITNLENKVMGGKK
jgi:hypothetical protein